MTTASLDEMGVFARTVMENRYSHNSPYGGKETWPEISRRVAKVVIGHIDAPWDMEQEVGDAIIQRKFMPGGRYLFASGHDYHQTQNCILLRAKDTREGWGEVVSNALLALMTGAGLGCNYSALREEGKLLKRAGGNSSGPLALMHIINELGRGARQGGTRRGAIWAGLNWQHPDIFKFIQSKVWSEDICNLKGKDFNAVAPLDFTNISVCLDNAFFSAVQPFNFKAKGRTIARQIFNAALENALKHGDPGFSIDVGANAGEDLRNACTEVTSADDSDICNLGSINMARVENIEEFRRLVYLGTLFLLAGSYYSDVPYEKVKEVRSKNRRLGLGLMGIHEWLLKSGYPYGPCDELAEWLEDYQQSTLWAALIHEEYKLPGTPPIKTRAIAPNGTIGIVAETTTGIEPIFCVAYKRRFRDGENWLYQYVVDPTANRLIQSGVKPENIEDAYDLAKDPERRVAFQAWLQPYVDHGISSTINLPAWGTEYNNEHTVRPFGEMLLKYLPHLRGITIYPDGARSGQPLNRVSYAEASANQGQTFVEGSDTCNLTKGAGCG